MDGFDLFRKLGSGAKFNFKRFQDDAEKLKLVAPRPVKNEVKFPVESSSVNRSSPVKRRLQDEDDGTPLPTKRLREGTGLSRDQGSDTPSDNDSESEECSSESGSDGEESDELQILGSMTSRGDENTSSGKKSKIKKKKKKKKKSLDLQAALRQEEVNHLRNEHRIHVYGSDVPEPLCDFQTFFDGKAWKLHPRILQNVRSLGFGEPTPIQMQAVPVMLERREVLACAPTGSGKTLAFILPLLHHLKEPRNVGFRALVLSPTRELAKQTQQEFSRVADGTGFRIHFIEKASTAVKKFGPKSSQKFDILVTTPNRLVHMLGLDPPPLKLGNVEWLVVDESDKLFEEGKTGFRDQLAVIYKSCDSANIRRALFSATFAFEVEEWCKLNLDNVVQVYIGGRNTATDTVTQELTFVGNERGKLIAVREMVQRGLEPPVLVFVQSKERAKELFHELIYDGINVDVIHAGRTQLQRDNVVKGFRAGKIWVLICTELMGRGIDFKGVNLVINYDFPNSAVSYIHRIGRTGRAGRSGRAITFFTEDDMVNLRSIANVMRGAGCPVPDYMLELKKPAKDVRRKMARSAPERRTILTLPRRKRKRKRKAKAADGKEGDQAGGEPGKALEARNGQKASGKGQKASGKEQKASGKGQKASGKGQKASGNGPKPEHTGKKKNRTSDLPKKQTRPNVPQNPSKPPRKSNGVVGQRKQKGKKPGRKREL